jgi:hypothetical protein
VVLALAHRSCFDILARLSHCSRKRLFFVSLGWFERGATGARAPLLNMDDGYPSKFGTADGYKSTGDDHL